VPFVTQPPDPRPRKPSLALPPGACDCHFHLFGPAQRYAWDPESPYLSADALPETYFALQEALGLQRGVLVSGGGYGRDYTHLVDTLGRYSQRLRGIVLPREDLDAREIETLDALGVRGMRFISERRHGKLPRLDEALARRAFDAAGWQVHFYPKDDLAALAPRLLALPNAVVLDHFGGIDADAQPDLKTLFTLLDSGRVWVKLSGPMRCTREDFPYARVTPLARQLVAHAPERLIWGSDWPHVNMNERAMPNDGDLVDLLKEWVPSETLLRQILVENPAKLFGFSAVS
jgi:predicted TIM-barrel fold metal-dependent hydrolase